MKTSELTGAALDWAVATAKNMNPALHKIQYGEPNKPFVYRNYVVIPMSNGDCWTFEPTVKWELAGWIIEREGISVYRTENGSVLYWVAEVYEGNSLLKGEGPTPLIAAMRCYVTSKFGDEVEVPEELQPSLSRDSF